MPQKGNVGVGMMQAEALTVKWSWNGMDLVGERLEEARLSGRGGVDGGCV